MQSHNKLEIRSVSQLVMQREQTRGKIRKHSAISVGTNSVRSSVFGFFGDVRKVRCSVFETELDVRVKVRPNFSEQLTCKCSVVIFDLMFGMFGVRFSDVRKVRCSEFSGSFQHYHLRNDFKSVSNSGPVHVL